MTLQLDMVQIPQFAGPVQDIACALSHLIFKTLCEVEIISPN